MPVALTGASNPDTPDERAFGGVARLFGDAMLMRLAAAHVVVAGVGGVGSWAVEALARSGVGMITLIDMDHVGASNLNRQIHALHSTLGASKISVMAARIADINPRCQVHLRDEFVTAGNCAELIPATADVIIDAIDQAAVKAAIAALGRDRNQPVVMCGAAGARTDPLALKQRDLAGTLGDPLLASVRSTLRKKYGFPRSTKSNFGVCAIYSEQAARGALPVAKSSPDTGDLPSSALACAGYGSIVTVTCVMGMAAAAATITVLGTGLLAGDHEELTKTQAQSGSANTVALDKTKRDQPVQQLEKT